MPSSASPPPAWTLPRCKTTLKDLGVTAIVDGSSSANGQDTLYRAGAALGLDGVARFDLVFTQGGGVAVRGADTVTADTLQASRSTWESLTITTDDTQDRRRCCRTRQGHRGCGRKGYQHPRGDGRRSPAAGGRGLRLRRRQAGRAGCRRPESIYYTPLFTYAANPDAEKTISFANYLAALYQEIAENDRDHWPEGWTGSEFTALAGNGRAGVRRHQPRHAAGPAAQGSPVQLVSVSADTARTLAGLDGVSCTYQESLSEYEPAGDTVLIVTDTQTLAVHRHRKLHGAARLRRCVLGCAHEHQRFDRELTTDFILPEAPRYGVGRNNK